MTDQNGSRGMRLITGNSNRSLAEAIGQHLKIEPVKAQVRRFADMEVFVEIQENVRGEDMFVIQSTSYPANDNLMELLIMIDALRRASARRMLANEFFDALPVRQYVKTEGGWRERMVVSKEGALEFALAPLPTPGAVIPASRAGAPDGGAYEVSAAATALTEAIARVVAEKGGGALLLDYGYGEKLGFGETLQAVGGHKFADVLAEPGENDLSAHVDFMALADAARHGGAAVYGPHGQGAFLAELGITARAEQLIKANPGSAESLLQAVARLIGPDQMGNLFKALAILPRSAAKPPGF